MKVEGKVRSCANLLVNKVVRTTLFLPTSFKKILYLVSKKEEKKTNGAQVNPTPHHRACRLPQLLAW